MHSVPFHSLGFAFLPTPSPSMNTGDWEKACSYHSAHLVRNRWSPLVPAGSSVTDFKVGDANWVWVALSGATATVTFVPLRSGAAVRGVPDLPTQPARVGRDLHRNGGGLTRPLVAVDKITIDETPAKECKTLSTLKVWDISWQYQYHDNFSPLSPSHSL
jgi:hypothetical protein